MKEAIFEQGETIALVRLLQQRVDLEEKVVARISELVLVPNEPGFRHPYDIAIATYLQALEAVHSALSSVAATKAVELQSSFFARKVATADQRIRSSPVDFSGSSLIIVGQPIAAFYTAANAIQTNDIFHSVTSDHYVTERVSLTNREAQSQSNGRPLLTNELPEGPVNRPTVRDTASLVGAM
jgi:hypothetical protein